MVRCLPRFSLYLFLGSLFFADGGFATSPVEFWLTDPGGNARFENQADRITASQLAAKPIAIELDSKARFQTIDGFGCTLTGGSAQHLLRMSDSARAALLEELFASNGTNIGMSYLRLSIGASDLNDRAWTYDDLIEGQTDPSLSQFSLRQDRADVIPVLKQIMTIQPEIKLMGSPWSAPAWMKTEYDLRGGSLKKEHFGVYADYFVKYIEGMRAEGISIDAVTPQNEPLHPGNNPSMFMSAEDQAEFIGIHLGPAFERARIATKIVCYDHNADRPDYPLTVLQDPIANRYVDGSAFHLYAGSIDALQQVHDAFPSKHLYFTEQWTGAPGNLAGDLAWHINELTIGATRNGCRVVLEWNLANGPDHQPHTDRGGCDRCLGAITIDGDKVTRNPAYYVIAHASKFVVPGSTRIASTTSNDLPNVAFQTPQGKFVVIVLNRGHASQAIVIHEGDDSISATLPPGAVGTIVWKNDENATE
ncbi:glycoside hydrolase family 30 protein [Novipirellula artificiosorum]|uniref:O-Glycosyl hydrolase family 30 n=1 Tax=Novipirellula artificiosorum TaxID=2528016 RepID=A0A5C6DVV4_9BACT|nr:glycoside hydrolase family 30 beta sandwich domain-containing protein [Novipirellula artificiosorum]TWU40485.1 O-Glycosyl hydrolase family 30 [Novipirellula artificiosorum]